MLKQKSFHNDVAMQKYSCQEFLERARKDSTTSVASAQKRQETPKKKNYITGSRNTVNFKGFGKPPPRRHVYVGRIHMEKMKRTLKNGAPTIKHLY